MPVYPPVPVEWVQGKSRQPWILGLWLVFTGSFLVADLVLEWGLSWTGIGLGSPRLTLVVQFAAIAAAIGPVLLWAILVRMPVSRMGVSPDGVRIDHGVRSDFWPWDRASLRGSRLEVFSSRYRIPSWYTLTPLQATRVASLRPTQP